MTLKFSTITLREKQEEIKVKIGSRLKPAIVSEVIEKWQQLLNLIIKIINDQTGFIMKLNEDTIKVFLICDEHRARQAGCDDYVTKPIKKSILIEKMKKFGFDEEKYKKA